jgi:hypothetical protein
MVNGLIDLTKIFLVESCEYDEIVARQQAIVKVLNIYKNKDVLPSFKLLYRNGLSCGSTKLTACLLTGKHSKHEHSRLLYL